MKRVKYEPMSRPNRDALEGFSYSEFKTFLKLRGHKVYRDLNQRSFITEYRNRLYRWRHWGDHYTGSKEFVVDISCVKSDFDRWANSVDKTITFKEYINENS